MRSGIAVLADSVATRLRREGLYAGGIQVTVRDPAFHDRSRQKQLPAPTHLIRDLTNAAMALTEELWTPPAPIRALTVTAIHLSSDGEAYEQANLFDPTAGQRNARQEKLESAMDAIRKNTAATPSSTEPPAQRKRRIPCHDPSGRKTAAPRHCSPLRGGFGPGI
ncbi:MAG: hypothetical protein ACLSHO_03070 [Dysosmobacter sp.]